jgi:hypothetical protein
VSGVLNPSYLSDCGYYSPTRLKVNTIYNSKAGDFYDVAECLKDHHVRLFLPASDPEAA